MKRTLHLSAVTAFIFLPFFITAFKGKNKSPLPKSIDKLKAVTYIPSGSWNNNSIPAFYMFTNEVSNLHYKEFLFALKSSGQTTLYNELKPDSSLWSAIDANGNDFYARTYSNMNEYPVVNISKKAAEAYCQWLSDFWNKQQSEFLVEFRLPTEAEWEYAASSGNNLSTHPYPWTGIYCRNAKGLYLAQHKAFGLTYGPKQTGSFFCNDYGLYNMSGNVAEMVADKNITKGGSWNSNEQEIKIQQQGKLEVSPCVGFRPVMTFLKR